MRDILLLSAARENSERVPDKMLRKFGDTTLFDIYVEKIVEINETKNPFNKIILAVCRKDKILWKKANDSGLEVAERSELSVSNDAKGMCEILDYLNSYDEKYVCSVNACFPFLSIDTILEIGEFFNINTFIKSLTCVQPKHNHFWDVETHKPINNLDKTCLDTKKIPPILESVNNIMIYEREFMFKNNAYWDFTKNNPYLYILEESLENLDIDTMMDFLVCESLYEREKLIQAKEIL